MDKDSALRIYLSRITPYKSDSDGTYLYDKGCATTIEPTPLKTGEVVAIPGRGSFACTEIYEDGTCYLEKTEEDL